MNRLSIYLFFAVICFPIYSMKQVTKIRTTKTTVFNKPIYCDNFTGEESDFTGEDDDISATPEETTMEQKNEYCMLPNGTLTINSPIGSIFIAKNPQNKLIIEVIKKGSKDSLNDITTGITFNSNQAMVNTKLKQAIFCGTIAYQISAPSDTNILINGGQTDISIEDINNAEANIEQGNVKIILPSYYTNKVYASTKFGAITYKDAPADILTPNKYEAHIKAKITERGNIVISKR